MNHYVRRILFHTTTKVRDQFAGDIVPIEEAQGAISNWIGIIFMGLSLDGLQNDGTSLKFDHLNPALYFL